MATLAPLIAKSQRGGFRERDAHVWRQPPIQLVGGRSSEGDATAKVLLERRDGSRFAVGTTTAPAKRERRRRPRPCAQRRRARCRYRRRHRACSISRRGAKLIFRHAVRAEDEFNVPTMYRNWDRERNADQPDSEEARYGGAFVGESVAAG